MKKKRKKISHLVNFNMLKLISRYPILLLETIMDGIGKSTYCSAGCNRNPHTLDWGVNGIICYGACNAVHLYKYEKYGRPDHIETLIGHKKIVTSVHWVRGDDSGNELITTSADHTAAIWTLKENGFLKTSILTGHSNVVQNASGIYLPHSTKKDLLAATLSVDSSLKVWQRVDGQTNCIQIISFGNGFGLDVKFCSLKNNNDLLMIVGADDSRIHIYIQNEINQFNPVLSLGGHEDWIQCLDVIDKDENTLLLASASQDCYIRIWKIVSNELETLPESIEYLKVDEAMFNSQKGFTYAVSLESVLSGHENWIYSVRWHMQKNANNDISSLQLLSASMDKTMIIWEADSNSNIWMEKIRVGEVGGNTLGFLGGVFSSCGKVIIAHGYQGAIHCWKLNEEKDNWEPELTFGGHFSSVSDINWDPDGEYLISCSSDQTTRIHAPYITDDGKNNWFEIARPQVHGYDMVCLAVLSRFQFVSAGDEKVLRVFQAPRSFAETLKNISKVDTSSYMKSNLAEGASVPSLGLSNKAVFEEDLNKIDSQIGNSIEKHPKDRYPDFYYTPLHLMAPPTEETLIQNTLWPEIQKLYGHPYEVFTVTSNHSRTLVASACKAAKCEHAAVALWDTSTWRQVGHLIAHSLTITQLEFSPDDEFLLSVSRDRMWVVYKHFPGESPPYKQIANLDKKNNIHTRIIWSCSWTFDSLYFTTASRDKKIAVWGKSVKKSETQFSLCFTPLEVEESATALSFAPCLTSNNKYILAIGLDNGCIIISTWCKDSGFSLQHKLNENISHHLTVNRLKFSPTRGEAGNKENSSNIVQLASCSNDHQVKIYNVEILNLT